jgi:hypothetical protein
MANNCYNWVQITGNKQVLDKIERRFKKYDTTKYFTEFGNLILEKSIDTYVDKPFDFYYKYGTKWWDMYLDRGDDETFTITGDTAWSPPEKLLLLMSEKYDVIIEHEFEEAGCNFAGEYRYEKGIALKKDMSYQEYVYLNNSEGFFDDILCNIEDEVEQQSWDEFQKDYICESVMMVITDKDLKFIKDEFEEAKRTRVS